MPRWSEIIELPDGTRAIVCHSGPRPKAKPCSCCRAPSSIQCDYPMLHGGTCDAFLCRHCAVPAGRNRDYCPTHEGNRAA